MHLLLLDNFDSFTFNLLDYFQQLGATVQVVRNDVPLATLRQYAFDAIVLSPGPGTPRQAGSMMAVIEEYHQRVPMLGVCLGHQALGEFFGGELGRAVRPMHGKVSTIVPTRPDPLFAGLAAPLTVTRYHSLTINLLPPELLPLAYTTDAAHELMAFRHRTLPLYGVQFHPEALLTTHGLALLGNWVKCCIIAPVGQAAAAGFEIPEKMELQIKEHNGFQYVEEGTGEVLLLLHGLFGALSNWEEVVAEFSTDYRVVIPLLPIYEMPLTQAGVPGLVSYVEDFLRQMNITQPLTLLGNSLGGHIGLVYTLRHPGLVRRLVLTGSSGLFEDSMGGSFPKRGNYAFVQERVAYTFYDPNIATKELVDEVFNVTNSNTKVLRIISIARSAQRHNLGKDLTKITVPALLVWGLNDTITPPVVAHEFHGLLPGSELHFLDHCGHVPMMEHPQKFNRLLRQFLRRTTLEPVLP